MNTDHEARPPEDTAEERGRVEPGHRQIIVLGMHRSGTSALTGALAKMGVYVGDQDELTRTNWENRKGFFERRDARQLCDALLHKSGADWWKISSFDADNANFDTVQSLRPAIRKLVARLNREGSWALKEPRLCYLLPIFQSALTDPIIIFVTRHPVEIAKSLRRRNGFRLQGGLALWEAYTVSALRHGLHLEHLFVDYDDLVGKPEETLRNLAAALAAKGVSNLDVDAALDSVQVSLRRERAGGEEDLALLSPEQLNLWRRLSGDRDFSELPCLSSRALTILREFEADQETLFALRTTLEENKETLASKKNEIEALAKERDQARAEASRLAEKREAQIEAAKALKETLLRREQQIEAQRSKLADAAKAENEIKRLARQLHADLVGLRPFTGWMSARLSKDDVWNPKRLGRFETEWTIEAVASSGTAHSTLLHFGKKAGQALSSSAVLLGALPLPGVGMARRRRRLEKSPLFDAAWYLKKNPDVAESGVPPELHYLSHGAQEGRDPHPLFKTDFYLERNPDVADAGVNPLEHFIAFGGKEGRAFHPAFDPEWYLKQNPDVAAAGLNPLEHYLLHGAAEGRNPSRNFNTAAYLREHPELAASGVNPLVHAVEAGRNLDATSGGWGASSQSGGDAGRGLLERALSPELQKSTFGKKLRKVLSSGFPNDFTKTFEESEIALRDATQRLAKHEEKPLVSIIMPTFNRAGIIEEAIQSVLEQDYPNWELIVCDDGSTDNTREVVSRFGRDRIHYLQLPRSGAATARNRGLARARGEIIAYLDSDNCWHPAFLTRMVLALLDNPGRSAVRANYVDYIVDAKGEISIKDYTFKPFDHERLLKKNFIDLNTFVHRRELYDCFGGFNDLLTRRQDYDLIIKYTWLRDPVSVEEILALYQRNENLHQITTARQDDKSCIPIINSSIDGYLESGLPQLQERPVKRVTILSWDMCRNHFSKPFALAEALSKEYEVQLVSFRFFEEEIFPPLKGVKPPFETVYLPGADFPDFFASMKKAVDVIDGDIIYVVKPRLPSLGVALLANALRGTPVMLEINDLETVVSSPKSEDRHSEALFESLELDNAELASPYSDLWSRIMDPIAKELPVLLTHNKNIDAHFGSKCLYMRNLKDERVYNPAAYERDAVRRELGIEPDDRVILFGGLLRKHKGIYELVELVDRLDDPRYKLLFVGSRPTPDQRKLVERYGDRVKVMPPQDREAMARINLAADLVILWLDPDVPASHYQMPYKATDAFAMGPSIIANDISDLGDLARQGYLRLVPFGDWDGMKQVVCDIFDRPDETARIRAASGKLFRRQFSYPAARTNFFLAAHRAVRQMSGPLPASRAFMERFNEFYRRKTGEGADLFQGSDESLPAAQGEHGDISSGHAGRDLACGLGAEEEDASIEILDIRNVHRLWHRDEKGVAVVMPSVNVARALDAARLLVRRAGMKTTVFIVEDTLRQGFIRTVNDVVARLDVRYFVYLAEDAFPGVDWLKTAYETLEKSGKGLLAFNCGKWDGRIAAFGMVRTKWVRRLYDGALFFEGYKSHKADNELTVIARVEDQFVYDPDCVLVEIDERKTASSEEGGGHANWTPQDRDLFYDRFHKCFDARFKWPQVRPFKDEYLNLRKIRANSGAPYEPSEDSIHMVDVQALDGISWEDPEGIAVVMPCIDREKAMNAARLLLRRSGVAARYFVVEDTARQGFIRTLNDVSAKLNVKYLVYLAEDAFGGVDWLKKAHDRLEETGKGLLAFNCGKWRGRVAAFGMVRRDWVQSLYGGAVLFPGYKAHKADNEITVIARVTDQLVYDPACLLLENDGRKVFRENVPEDKSLFHRRFREGFDGIVELERLKELASAYFVKWDDPAPQAVSQPAASLVSEVRSGFYRRELGQSEIEELKKEYTAKGLDKEKDTFALYRIIGNDLHPRHALGQSRQNLQFILENESELPDCEKHYIVNRIIDPSEERKIVDLLKASGASFEVIPFDPDEYRKLGFDMAAMSRPDLLTARYINSFEPLRRQRVRLALYRLKNNYVMNNNGARNFALESGRHRAKWVLPFDGNCFFTPSAWEDLRSEVSLNPHFKYFVVPMTRVTSNRSLLSDSFEPEPLEEPQLLFRRDSEERFNEEFCYGRRPKVELFWRLQIAGKWDEYKDDAWDRERRPASPEAGQFGVAGWVARMFSGVEAFETQDSEGAEKRHVARADAILETLQSLDVSISGASEARCVSVRDDVLAAEAVDRHSSELAPVMKALRQAADEALDRGPYSVTDKTTLPPSGNKQDYWHPAPYWWPDPKKPDGLPYIRKDGERVPGTRMYEPDSEKYDRTRLQRVFDDSLTLALAAKVFGEKHYADHGAKILERFFVDRKTRMKPHLKFGQVRMGHDGNEGAPAGLIEMKDMYYYLDAVRLIDEAGSLSPQVKEQFHSWLDAYLHWLLTSRQGKAERTAENNHGTCYDLQVASIAAFLGEKGVLFDTLARAQSRIAMQFTPEGAQPDELKRKTTAHYCCFNLQSWINLAELSSRWGLDLWSYSTSEGAGLKSAARWLLAHSGKPWPYEQIDAFDEARFIPVWAAAHERMGDELGIAPLAVSPYAVKPVYFPHDGIRPFWNLGSYRKGVVHRSALVAD